MSKKLTFEAVLLRAGLPVETLRAPAMGALGLAPPNLNARRPGNALRRGSAGDLLFLTI